MDPKSISAICSATVVSRLTYAISAWWGFVSAADKEKLQAVINGAKRWGFCGETCPPIADICAKREHKLFNSILINPCHVLRHLLPPEKHIVYSLRPRAHNRELPNKTNSLYAKNFLTRLLYNSLQQ